MTILAKLHIIIGISIGPQMVTLWLAPRSGDVVDQVFVEDAK